MDVEGTTHEHAEPDTWAKRMWSEMERDAAYWLPLLLVMRASRGRERVRSSRRTRGRAARGG